VLAGKYVPDAAKTFSASTRVSAGTETCVWNASVTPSARMVSGEDVVATMASLWPSPGGFLSNALRFRTIVAVCSAYSVPGPEVPSYVAPLCPKLPPESEYPFVKPTSPGGTPSNVSRPSTTSNET